jgi:hypothetical protein
LNCAICVGIQNNYSGVSVRTVSITGSPVFFGIVINILIVTVVGDVFASSPDYQSLLLDHPLPAEKAKTGP